MTTLSVRNQVTSSKSALRSISLITPRNTSPRNSFRVYSTCESLSFIQVGGVEHNMDALSFFAAFFLGGGVWWLSPARPRFFGSTTSFSGWIALCTGIGVVCCCSEQSIQRIYKGARRVEFWTDLSWFVIVRVNKWLLTHQQEP